MPRHKPIDKKDAAKVGADGRLLSQAALDAFAEAGRKGRKFDEPMTQMAARMPVRVRDRLKAEAKAAGVSQTDFYLDALDREFTRREHLRALLGKD